MSLLDEARKLEREVIDRLRELEPQIREYEQLRKLAEQLGLEYTPQSAAADAGAEPPATTRRRTSRAKAAKAPARTAAKAQAAAERPASRGGRSRARKATPRSGRRADQVLQLVGESPGISVREIGERLGVDPTGLYRVVNRLTESGRLRKDGPRLDPVQPAASAPARAAATTPAAAAGGGIDAREAGETAEAEAQPSGRPIPTTA